MSAHISHGTRKFRVRSLRLPAFSVRREFVDELRRDGVPESFIAKIEPQPVARRT